MSEEYLFNIPQRLNSLGYVINVLKTFVRILKQFIFFIAYLLYKQQDFLYSPYFILTIVLLLLLVALVSFVNFRSFKYFINEEASEFIVVKGAISKSKVVIKFSNILQVNITQNVLQKVLSLYSLTLDTAGSDKVEVDLYALDGYHATKLKELLLSKINNGYVANEGDDIASLKTVSDAHESILSLSTKNIILVSLFSNYRQGLALFFAFLVSIIQNFKDTIDTFELNEDTIDTATIRKFVLGSMFTFVFIGFVALVSVPFIINIVRYYFKYYNFTIVRNSTGNLSMQYGLFKEVNTIFNREKIQLLIFRQNKLLKKMGIGILSLKQLVTDANKEDKSSIDIPGIAIGDKDKVYTLAFGDILFANLEILKPHIGLLINRMIKMVFLYAALVFVALFLEIEATFTLPLFVFLILATTGYNYIFYKNYSMVYNEHFIIKRYGVWNEKEVIIPISKLQGIEISQSFFQKRSYTANLGISTAAKKISFRFFPLKDTNQIANYMLYRLEK